MASLMIDGDRLRLRFSALEKIGGLRRDVDIALEEVASAEVSPSPWKEAKGLRVGTGIPGVILLGTMLRSRKNDVAAVYGSAPIVVVSLKESGAYQRLLVTVPDPEGVASSLREAIGQAQAY